MQFVLLSISLSLKMACINNCKVRSKGDPGVVDDDMTSLRGGGGGTNFICQL